MCPQHYKQGDKEQAKTPQIYRKPKEGRDLSTSRRKPSFRGLAPASFYASKSKRANRAKNTLPELRFRSSLWQLGYRFRANVDDLPGKPDVVFATERVAVFCDGDFWHGRDWNSRRRKLAKGHNADYWLAKIKANMQRDRRNTRVLERGGWRVVRIWEGTIRVNPMGAALRTAMIVEKRRLHSP